MYSAEVLSQLRTLDWLEGELRRLDPLNSERKNLEDQVGALRQRLPLSILQYHDARSRKGLPSMACLIGGECGNCHVAVPADMVHELSRPGCFAVCPQCGVFLWSEVSTHAASEPRSAGARPAKAKGPGTENPL